MRILVVDTEPLVGAIVRMMLAPDHIVTTVSTGTEAWALLQQEDFHLVICDTAIRDLTSTTRTLYTSTFPVEDSLLKPFSREELRQAVADALQREGHGRRRVL